ncbi:DEAD/DEAH box helicase [Nocardioides gansuensis]|uniref:DEAD/DEAH box helicase n=1 Tax=Nocardioides gansuensis TaxID=2138300 RepID=A0A2T8F935_9ACTN|nr:DEAD/DEAH box helicase family protein [Nocardioides gansuensis]PVG82177.1 DEAD/DEAH box helicase [Nocardioides gansuensis]
MTPSVEAAPPQLRHHQRLALDSLDAAWAEGCTRAWIVLPPGAGKTLVGVETVRRLVGEGKARRGVVLSPNTAIQGQWVAAAQSRRLTAGTGRALDHELTSLTYQSVATFDPDDEDDVDREGEGSLITRLHPNGEALVQSLKDAGELILVLDECHHLLQVWGRLLAEILRELPKATVLGLTATPPDAMTREESELVASLFGPTVFEASIPGVVRQGDLAPFAELVWLTEPTSGERDWLAESAVRFAELTTDLLDPAFGSVPLLHWLDQRFGPSGPSWAALSKAEPELARAALRLHYADVLALPQGATLHEEHRRPPTADDWVRLVDDWARGHLLSSDKEEDERVVQSLKRALPSVGYVWTRRGIRAGRSPVDRVLARSESKTTATTAIAAREWLALGERQRLLVLCDHEQASATLPADLHGVITAQSGSARAVLHALLDDPATPAALLVTGANVAGAKDTLAALVDHVAATDPQLAAGLVIDTSDGLPRLVGSWSSRAWVPHVTRFFEAGGVQVLVGTRGLLGEGWDARRVTGIVDLTAVTTTTAVTQTRGRALRTDPAHPDKVAINWTVVCVAAGHPRGDGDWGRLVRKHTGYFGVDPDGSVVDGVAHIDAALSPYAPPPASDFDAINARMLARAEARAMMRERWRIGEPYDDQAVRTVRLRPGAPDRLGSVTTVPAVVVREQGLDVRADLPCPLRPVPPAMTWSGIVASAGWLALEPHWLGALPLALPALAPLVRRWSYAERGRALVEAAAVSPSPLQVASAVADGLHEAGLVSQGAEALTVSLTATGEYRIRLGSVPEQQSGAFAAALEEVFAPIASPRYVLPRYVVVEGERTTKELASIGRGRSFAADGVVWHAVPSCLTTRRRVEDYAKAWDRWVGGGTPVYTGSPEGAGVLAAQRGSDPFDVTTVIRREWS